MAKDMLTVASTPDTEGRGAVWVEPFRLLADLKTELSLLEDEV